MKKRISRSKYTEPKLQRLKDLFDFSAGWVKIEMVPRTEREKQIIRTRVIVIAVIVIIISLILVFFRKQLGTFVNSHFETFLSSSIAGIATIVTTYFIVHHGKKVDYHRERLAHMPIFKLTIKEIKDSINDHWLFEIDSTITNIGKGIAFNISFDIVTYQHLNVGDSEELESFPITSDSPDELEIEFDDIFENKYKQKFYIYYKSDKTIDGIGCSAPELIQRTRRFRYVQ